MASHQGLPEPTRQYRRTSWMEKEICVPPILGLLGKVMRHSCMELRWSDHSFHDLVGQGPIMSTPYPPGDEEDRRNSSMTAQPPTPATPDTDSHVHRPPPEVRQGYRPAAPIQRFNNKSLNWPAWFRHFRVVADVHGWSKDQRALQLVSYLDETAMNVAQELGDNDLYNYDVKQLSDRLDPFLDFTADLVATMRMPSLMPSQNCVE